MTVGELKEILARFPDGAVVFEDNKGECRQLSQMDVRFVKHVVDADHGIAYNAMDQQPSDPDLVWLMSCPGFLVFGAWS